MSSDDEYFSKIETFEKESEKNNIYDFRVGSKIKKIMQECGLEIIISEPDWYDRELNFKGKAAQEIVENWSARLERMVMLKAYLGTKYPEFCSHFLDIISKESHTTKDCVKYYVGIKRCFL